MHILVRALPLLPLQMSISLQIIKLCTHCVLSSLLTTCYLVFNAWDVFRKRHDTADAVRAHIECVVENFGRGWVTNDTAGCPSAPAFNDNKELLGEVLVAIDGLIIGLILLDPKLLSAISV